jgi:hypothetical protein
LVSQLAAAARMRDDFSINLLRVAEIGVVVLSFSLVAEVASLSGRGLGGSLRPSMSSSSSRMRRAGIKPLLGRASR